MKISKKSEYALRALACLGAPGAPQVLSIQEIARRERIKISKKSEYALRALACLGAPGAPQVLSIQEIARRERIPGRDRRGCQETRSSAALLPYLSEGRLNLLRVELEFMDA